MADFTHASLDAVDFEAATLSRAALDSPTAPGGGPSGDARLLESGDYRLLESGDYRLLE